MLARPLGSARVRSFWDTLDEMTQGVPEHPANGLDPLIGLRPNWLSESVVLRRPATDASPIASLQNPTEVPFSELGSRQLFVQNEDFGWVIGKDAHGRIELIAVAYVAGHWKPLTLIRLHPAGPGNSLTNLWFGLVDQPSAHVPSTSAQDFVFRCIGNYEDAGFRRDWASLSRAWSVELPALHVAVEPEGSISASYGQDALLSIGLTYVAGQRSSATIPSVPRTVEVVQLGRLAVAVSRNQLDSRDTDLSVYLLANETSTIDTRGRRQDEWVIVSQISLIDSPANGVGLVENTDTEHREAKPVPGPDEDRSTPGPQSSQSGKSALAPEYDEDQLVDRISSEKTGSKLTFFKRIRGTSISLASVAAIASVIIYIASRLVSLSGFPIYFHGDEAYQIVAGQRLVASGFRNELNVLFPLYFSNGGSWAPLLPVYFHIVSTTLFGTSVETARGTAAVFSTFGVVAATLFARDGIRARTWWAVPLWFTIVPAWFLHSRTTFETVYAVSGFAVFLFAYLKYRERRAAAGYGAVIAAAFTFYTYTNGQLIIGLAGVLLVLTDLPYHWSQRRHLIPLLAVGIVCLVPYIVFQRAAPDATADQLWRVSSYLVLDIPLAEKIRLFAFHYWGGLTPTYWFRPTQLDLGRHLMIGYTHLPQLFAPFILIGIAVSTARIRQPVHRIVLIALITAPIGASLTDVGITRVLAVIVPATLLAVVGLEWLIALPKPDRAPGRFEFQRKLDRWAQTFTAPGSIFGLARPGWHAMSLFAVGAFLSLSIVTDSLLNGPTWLTEYGLYGQQWGAVQIFREVVERAKKSPEDKFLISSTWANGTDLYLPFFVPALQNEGRVLMANVRDFLGARRPLDEHMVFVMTADEVQMARASRRFGQVLIDTTMRYPDGSDAFSFVRLGYSANFDQIVSEDRAARIALRNGQVVVKGQRLEVRHTLIDAGSLGDIFDGDSRTLGRFNGGNPAILEFAYPQPREASRLTIVLSAGNWDLTVKTYSDGGAETIYRKTVESRVDPTIDFDLNPGKLSAFHIEILQRGAGQESIVHLRDIIVS